MYSNEYIDISEIDTDRLENDLYDYYGTGAFAVSPAMFDKAERVRRMSDEELVKTAVREGFDINEYLRRGYDKAVKNGFYFEAMLIVYAIMEDRLRAWLFYLGCLNTRQSTRFDNKRSKNELKFMFDGCENDKFRFPSINQISGKRKIIEATLTWADITTLIRANISVQSEKYTQISLI